MRPLGLLVAIAFASLAAGAASSRAASDAGPTAATGPTAVGAPVVGQRLTALPGRWSGSGTPAYRYQWYRCDENAAHCNSIHGATSQSYRVVPADTTHTIGLTVNATDTTGTTSAYAGVVGPIVAAATPLVSTVQPVASGTVVQGSVVQVGTGAWSRKPTTLTYVWSRCNQNGRVCTPIASATANTYLVTADDVGHALLARVTATVGTTSASTLSAPVAVTAATGTGGPGGTTSTAGPVNAASPAIAGTSQEGSQLVGTAGTWTGSGALSYRYQWYRCDAFGAHCNSIHGATAATYRLVAQDVAHTMGLTVNATDSAGTNAGYSSLIGPIAQPGAALVAATQPTVTGTPATGQKVTASTGTWTSPPTSTNYAWQRCNANGRVCAAIAGATAATYTVTADDQGHRLLAIVQAVSGDRTAEALSTAVRVG